MCRKNLEGLSKNHKGTYLYQFRAFRTSLINDIDIFSQTVLKKQLKNSFNEITGLGKVERKLILKRIHMSTVINPNKLTKYERARIIGQRATQIANGARPCIDYANDEKPEHIAERELDSKKTPLILKRTMPDGSTIEIDLKNDQLIP